MNGSEQHAKKRHMLPPNLKEVSMAGLGFCFPHGEECKEQQLVSHFRRALLMCPK